MKKIIGAVAIAAVALGVGAAAFAQSGTQKVKIGVVTDMSGVYQDIGGPGSVAAAKLAIEDYAKINPNLKVELISGDHQNKPDIGSALGTQ